MAWSTASREENFKAYHDWFKAAIQDGPAARVPDRAAFGLPHNYYSIADRQKAEVEPRNRRRRASPLLIHIQPTIQAGYLAVLTRLSGRFLPGGETVALQARNRTVHAPIREDWREVLDGLFDGPPPGAKGDPGPYFAAEQRHRILPTLGRADR
jgi:hypothetical protein